MVCIMCNKVLLLLFILFFGEKIVYYLYFGVIDIVIGREYLSGIFKDLNFD